MTESAGAKKGTLYLCATPIGNLGDVTIRVLDILRSCPVIAAEDTRRTRALLSRYDIHTPLSSYREENRRTAGERLLRKLESGQDVALVSDAGTPGISDPGHDLVVRCLERGIPVDAVPGPNAAVTALVVSGLPVNRFSFEGFPPRKPGARRRLLEELAGDARTLIFYESPQRVAGTLRDIHEVMGDRRVAVARELTKKFQQVLRGTASEVAERLEGGPVRGEVVLVVEGAAERADPSYDEAAGLVLELRERGLPLKEAVARVAADRPGISRSRLYNEALSRREGP